MNITREEFNINGQLFVRVLEEKSNGDIIVKWYKEFTIQKIEIKEIMDQDELDKLEFNYENLVIESIIKLIPNK